MEWISVKERLPERFAYVLVYSPEDGRAVGRYYGDGRWNIKGVRYPDTPTYWMPLPEKPQEQE